MLSLPGKKSWGGGEKVEKETGEGGVKGSDEREGGMGGKKDRKRGREAHDRYILCSCLHALRVLQKNGHLPTESHLFQEYAGYVVMTTVVFSFNPYTKYGSFSLKLNIPFSMFPDRVTSLM